MMQKERKVPVDQSLVFFFSFVLFFFFALVSISCFVFSCTFTLYCRLNHSAKSSLCQTWQFEHTLFKIGFKQWSDFLHCQKISPWDPQCYGRLSNQISEAFFCSFRMLWPKNITFCSVHTHTHIYIIYHVVSLLYSSNMMKSFTWCTSVR